MQKMCNFYDSTAIQNWIAETQSERFDILFTIQTYFNDRMRW